MTAMTAMAAMTPVCQCSRASRTTQPWLGARKAPHPSRIIWDFELLVPRRNIPVRP